ncbi:MAG TPA: Gfo/Idh/MocA family oxidoreductase [Arachnia sp.]|nr:Gfo/Idh/MocA family oxidoreductase [Arachnia sp.]HMT86594.1 Gfo/Idh/MocA family oxidoreductase [Arachnia sp.]
MQRFALLGAGFIGSVHAGNLAGNPDVEFVSVYDAATERADALAGRYGVRSARSVEEALDGVDAVFIASSTDTHAANLRAAVDAGVAALCEKPIDLSMARAREVVEYAKDAKVMVNFNRRFDPDHAELKRIVDDGQVGAVEVIQLTSRGPVVPPLDYIKVSGGQFRDHTVHFFDLARWVAGADPVEVFATGSALADPRLADYDDTDTCICVLKLPGGALVQIDNNRRTGYGYDERLEVLGSTGMVQSMPHRVRAVTRYGAGEAVQSGMPADWFDRMRPTYALALDHFVQLLETGEPIAPSLSDGLKAQAIAEAATKSFHTGRSEPIDY